MHWTRSGWLLALSFALLPHAAASQLVMRDDVAGWGWLAFVTDRIAIGQLAYGSPQNSEQGRLDVELVEDLRARGVRRVFDPGSFDPAESQVVAECTGVTSGAEGSDSVQIGLHAEISYWDHTRLAATEIYESISLGSAPREGFAPQAYVQECSNVLTGVLTRLGFDQG